MRSLTHSLYSYYLCSYRGLSSLQYCSNVSSMLAWSHHSLLQHQPSPAIGSDVIVHGTSHRELCRRLRWWRCADHSGTAARAANLFQLWRRRRGRRHRKVDGAQLRRIDDEATAVRWGPLFAQPIPRARPSFGPRAAKRRRCFAWKSVTISQLFESFPTPCQPFQNSHGKAESTYPRRSTPP